MKRHEDAPLDAEERALAAQLRRVPPHGEPAPDLDARILAMARTAAGGRRTIPWYRGLPGYASAAAVCVLAAGLAWQLWPAHVQRGEGAAATAPVPPAPKPAADVQPAAAQEAASTAGDAVADKAVMDDAATPVAPRKEMLPPQPPRPAPERSVPPTPQPATIPSASDTSNYSAPEPAAAVRVMAPPPAPPAPPAPPPPPAPSMQAAPAAASAEGTVNPRELPKPAPASVTVNAMRAKTADDTENGYDARPPATVQDSSVRSDWLKRIRELMAQGDRDGARSSLLEYKSRYPEATIPADLQPLLAQPPAKSP